MELLTLFRAIESMVKNCCVVGCHNVFKAGSNTKFHRFPKDEERRAKWIAAVRRENWTPNDNTCMDL